jgi:AcrR family transcriptional regulator
MLLINGDVMSMPELKKKEREERRKYIIEAAEKLFFSKGYDSVTMSDIAGELGINKATLYLYFKNKDLLYFAVLHHGLLIMHDMLLSPLKEDMTGFEKIMAICRAFFSYCRLYPGHYSELCYARTKRFEMCRVENAMGQIVTAKEITDGICTAIKEGIKDGTIRKGLDPVETAVFIMASCESMVRPGRAMEWALSEWHRSPESYLEHSMGILAYSISSNKVVKK